MTTTRVFALSWLAAHAFWLIERLAGIGWDFHPDAVVYALDYDLYADDLFNLPNNLYFFVSAWLGGQVEVLIELNIILYALTNAIGWRAIRDGSSSSGLDHRVATLLSAVFLLQIYRLHLGVHVLKDTSIIFLLTVLVVGVQRRFWLALPLMLAMRLSSIFYLVALLPRRLLFALLLMVPLVLMLPGQDLLAFLVSRNEADMGGREFNTVPNFEELGMAGVLARGLIWPLLLLTGGFIGLSPAASFLPIAVELAGGRLALMQTKQLSIQWLPILVSLALMAVLVNSFTAYLRYGYPLVCVMPLLCLKLKPKI